MMWGASIDEICKIVGAHVKFQDLVEEVGPDVVDGNWARGW